MKATVPVRQIRADYSASSIRVYQAFSDEIADAAVERGLFVSPPFKMDRMTWIKPSFLWTMYRSGWALKDRNQKRILAIDISREGFEWALAHSCLSHFIPGVHESRGQWRSLVKLAPVRIQWDPERDIQMRALDYRSIQVGLSGDAVNRYVNEWTVQITDITPLVRSASSLIESGRLDAAAELLPNEREYLVPRKLALRIHVGE